MVQENSWSEGKTDTLAAGNNDESIDLAKGTTGQLIRRVKVAVPGALGNLTVIFYDDAAATTPISGTLNLAAQPPEGFDLQSKSLSSGTLGWRIAGWTGGATTAFVNASYYY